MSFVEILEGVNYGLVFFFGSLLMLCMLSSNEDRQRLAVCFAVYWPVSLALQTVSWMVLGLQMTKQIYPLIAILPILLIFIFGLKKPVAISVVVVCTGYLCCQLPRFGETIVTAVTGSALAGQTVYTVIIVPIFFFLQRYFVPAARDAMTESPRSLFLFGGLPVIYFVFDYATAIYSDVIYSGSRVVAQTLPTVVGLLYMIYTVAYRQQLLQRTQTELQNSLMAGQLKQAEAEMAALRQAETQSAVYRHDMRHHLAAIDAFLAADKPRQAEEYIRQVRSDIEAITPRRYCENELVNLLCSSFSAKAERMGVRLTLKANLPGELSISNTELCALLSNGLENAFHAVGELSENRRWVEFSCCVQTGKLLVEVKNPYTGQISFRDGLPQTTHTGHGHGCRSIRTIAHTCRGLCSFEAKDGIFTLRVVLPIEIQ